MKILQKLFNWFKADKQIRKGKVLVVVITKDVVNPECWRSILDQDYSDYDCMIHVRKPKLEVIESSYPDPNKFLVHKYVNCADNRETARKLALASDADRFLFVDSDIVLPKYALSNMMKQPFEIIGGWYRVAFEDRYTCGRYVADNLFLNLYKVEPSLVKVDAIGMGCALFSRKALENITFEHGTDLVTRTVIDGQETQMMLGECGVLSNRLYELGYQPYMDGSVVCDHLTEDREP